MSRSYPAAALRANSPSEVGFGEPRKTSGVFDAVIQVSRHLWPRKTAAEIAIRARVSSRSAENWLARRADPNAQAFCALLHSEEGFEFLIAAMADAEPAWWRLARALMDTADATKLQAVARRRLRRAVRGALDADRDITAAIDRAETLLVFDEEFMRPHVAALRTTSRVSGRTLASSTREKLKRRELP